MTESSNGLASTISDWPETFCHKTEGTRSAQVQKDDGAAEAVWGEPGGY